MTTAVAKPQDATMRIDIAETKAEMGRRAAMHGGRLLKEAIERRGSAAALVATGTSQFETLSALAADNEIAWSRVTLFHLDEYIGLSIRHPASFRKYLWERFHRRLPEPPHAFHYIDGEADPGGERRRLSELVRARPIDVAFIGIGENGHLAFNDPPADFETEEPYLIVELDEACRGQQVGEGWFGSMAEVPTRAISISCRRLLKSAAIICSVPDRRKAEAVRAAVKGEVTPAVPASILQRHADTTLYLDQSAAALL